MDLIDAVINNIIITKELQKQVSSLLKRVDELEVDVEDLQFKNDNLTEILEAEIEYSEDLNEEIDLLHDELDDIVRIIARKGKSPQAVGVPYDEFVRLRRLGHTIEEIIDSFVVEQKNEDAPWCQSWMNEKFKAK